ncbi:MAG: BtpA/SgcQ family protein, partial [Anaerolineales bacterium]
MLDWLQEVFGVKKPVIAMCHLAALPGDPQYDHAGGIDKIIQLARHDLQALQTGGVDAIMFSNESSLPYLTKVEQITTTTMARVIGELLP